MTRRLGFAANDHIRLAESALRKAYKSAAKIDQKARRGNCQGVWTEIAKTYGEARTAQAHLDSIRGRLVPAERRSMKQASRNADALIGRVLKSINSVGYQCTRGGGLHGTKHKRRK